MPYSDPERQKAYTRAWKEAHPEQSAALYEKYRVRRRERIASDPEFAAAEAERKLLAKRRRAATHRERMTADPDYARSYREARRRRHLDRMATDIEYATRQIIQKRAHRKSYKARQDPRELHLRATYGIGRLDYDMMYAKQDGRCAICGGPPVGRENFDVDHDHETGRVRGLLCFPCNNGLGAFRDRPERLSAAILYLGRHRLSVESAA